MNYEEILKAFEIEKECPISKMSDIEAAYIAGIVDGEGCISASVSSYEIKPTV